MTTGRLTCCQCTRLRICIYMHTHTRMHTTSWLHEGWHTIYIYVYMYIYIYIYIYEHTTSWLQEGWITRSYEPYGLSVSWTSLGAASPSTTLLPSTLGLGIDSRDWSITCVHPGSHAVSCWFSMSVYLADWYFFDVRLSGRLVFFRCPSVWQTGIFSMSVCLAERIRWVRVCMYIHAWIHT